MKPHARTAQTAEMFRPRLDEQLNMKHPLIRLTNEIREGQPRKTTDCPKCQSTTAPSCA